MLNNQQPVTSSPLVNRFILVFPLKIFQAVCHSLSWIALSQIQTELTFHTTLSKTSAQMSIQEPISPAIICRKILFSYIIKLLNLRVLMTPNQRKFCHAVLLSVMMPMAIIHVPINQTVPMDVAEEQPRNSNQPKSSKFKNHTARVFKRHFDTQ